jgi:starvation-inducible DNA-binding protein
MGGREAAAMAKKNATMTTNGHGKADAAQPILHQRGPVIQEYGTLRDLPVGVGAKGRQPITEALNQLLADTIMLYSMYKKHHWQVKGHTFYQLHLLFDKHAEEQLALVDLVAERIQLLGGVTTGMPADVAKLSKIENPPSGIEEPPAQISRLLEAHATIINETNDAVELTEQHKDWGTNDLLMSDILRTNQLQVWFISQHLVDVPVVRAD